MSINLVWQIQASAHNYLLTKDKSAVIGRQPMCDIVLNEEGVSDRHAEVFAKDNQFQVCNLGNSGTTIVYAKQTIFPGETVALQTGCTIQLGNRHLVVQSIKMQDAQKILNLSTSQGHLEMPANEPVIIGRREDCDIVLDTLTVARCHVALSISKGVLYMHNISQIHRTSIHIRQKLAQHEIAPLHPEGSLLIGQTHILAIGHVDCA